jgi:hypothetical protein
MRANLDQRQTMDLLNDDLMRTTRRFDAAGRPMTRDIAQQLMYRAPRRSVASRLGAVLQAGLAGLARCAPDGSAVGNLGAKWRPMRGIGAGLRAVQSGLAVLFH